MRTLIFSLAATAAVFSSSPAASAQGYAQEGDVPNFQLGSQSYNTMGAKEAADFRGKPVLVEYWGTH